MTPFFYFLFLFVLIAIGCAFFRANSLMDFIMVIAGVLIFFSPIDYLDGHGEDIEDIGNNESLFKLVETECEDHVGAKIVRDCSDDGRICFSKIIHCNGGG